MHLSHREIIVGARPSALSVVQVQEVYNELKLHHPEVVFKTSFVKTQGDYDRKTSLRTLEKSDFFTREIDLHILAGKCRIGIHSAKDLPDPLRQGLKVIGLTQGLDARDVLVMREESLESLKTGAIIATSSLRREKNVLELRSDFTCVDIRGTIEERLEKLSSKQVDGVVMAEAALIRLKLTHLPRVFLPGETALLQGRLAIVSQEEDKEMERLFCHLTKGIS